MDLLPMTPNGDLPDTGTAVDTTPDEDPIEALSELLDDPETPDPDGQERTNEADADDPYGEAAAADAENVDGDQPDDGPDAEIKGGRFAPDSAKVTLDDGRVTTIAELKRNNLFQRDYTKKTEAVKAEREAVETLKSEYSQLAQSLNQQREYVAWFAENYLPKQPEPFNGDPNTNPVGYLNYLKQEKAFEQAQAVLNYFQQAKQQEAQHAEHETVRERQERAKAEFGKFIERAPDLRDQTKLNAFYQSAINGGAEHYGFSEQEIRGIEDHRMVLALRDALAYRRLKSKAPEVPQQLQKRPAMVKGGKRAGPGAQDARSRQVRTERLRQSGSDADFIAAIEDLL
jgi:hypothetical protein